MYGGNSGGNYFASDLHVQLSLTASVFHSFVLSSFLFAFMVRNVSESLRVRKRRMKKATRIINLL